MAWFRLELVDGADALVAAHAARLRAGELGLDRGAAAASSSAGDADLLHDLGEEAAHDEAARLVLGDAAGLQVEQLLVVEAAGGAGVAGAGDVAGLDLEVRDRVGAGAVGEHEVAVLLVAVGAGGVRCR